MRYDVSYEIKEAPSGRSVVLRHGHDDKGRADAAMERLFAAGCRSGTALGFSIVFDPADEEAVIAAAEEICESDRAFVAASLAGQVSTGEKVSVTFPYDKSLLELRRECVPGAKWNRDSVSWTMTGEEAMRLLEKADDACVERGVEIEFHLNYTKVFVGRDGARGRGEAGRRSGESGRGPGARRSSQSCRI